MYKLIKGGSDFDRQLKTINNQVLEITLSVINSLNIKTNDDLTLECLFYLILKYDSNVYIEFLKSLSRINSVITIFNTTIPKVLGFDSQTFLISSPPISHVVSSKIKLPGWYTGYPAHKDWFSVRGSKSTITVWLPIYYSFGEPLHNLGFYNPSANESIDQIIGDHGYYLQLDDNLFKDMPCPLGDFLVFDGFQPHKSIISRSKSSDICDLRVALSFRYEFIDDLHFLQSGLKNNYFISCKKDTSYSSIDLCFDGSGLMSEKLITKF